MLGYEGGEEKASPSDAIDPVAQERLGAGLHEQFDDPPPTWLAPIPLEIQPAPVSEPRHLTPWRSATVAVLAQIPATLEATFLDVPLLWLTVQVMIVATMGVCLVLAEWMSINRIGLADEAPQPNLEQPHPHRNPHR